MADRRRAVLPWREDDTDTALHDRYRRESNPLVKTRLHALWLLRQGRTPQGVVKLVGVGYRIPHRFFVVRGGHNWALWRGNASLALLAASAHLPA